VYSCRVLLDPTNIVCGLFVIDLGVCVNITGSTTLKIGVMLVREIEKCEDMKKKRSYSILL
jgi:hypothetical protein